MRGTYKKKEQTKKMEVKANIVFEWRPLTIALASSKNKLTCFPVHFASPLRMVCRESGINYVMI